MSTTQETKQVDLKSSSLQAAEKSKEKSAEDKKKDIVWAYVYSTMCSSLTTTMMATSQENKAFAATQSNMVQLNNQLLQYQNQALNACFAVGDKKNLIAVDPNNDPNVTQATYYITINGKALTVVTQPIRGYNLDNKYFWGWPNLSKTNCQNICAKLKSLGVTGVGVYRQANGKDYIQADQNNEKITAQRDFLTNELQTETQGSQLQSSRIGTLGQMATQQIDFIDNVANEVGKLGDQGANQ